MTRESLLYKIMSLIHIVLFTSLLAFSMIFLTGSIFTMPVLGAVFQLGKDVIEKKMDINDSIVKKYFAYFKKSLVLMRFSPVNVILLINIAGMVMAVKSGLFLYSILCLSFVSFLLVLMLYIVGYHTFVDKKVNLMNVLLCMFLKPQYLIPIFIIMVLCTFFASTTLAMILFFTGTFFVFALEVLIFIQILYYKKMIGTLKEENEFYYMINRLDRTNRKEK